MHGDSWPNPHEDRDIAAAESRKRNGPAATNTQRYEITNVHLFDGHKYHDKLTSVIIDGDKIGSDATGAIKIDGEGGTLMPGLIDSHTHPTSIDHLHNLTRFGITSTIGMSCFQADLCASLRDQPGLTSLISSGWSATVIGSAHYRMNGNNTAAAINNTSEAPQWISDRISTGSDFIKLVSEATPPTMSLDEHTALISAAHSRKYHTATHASTLASYLNATLSLTDHIQHTPDDGPVNATLLDLILKHKQDVTPTLQTYLYASTAFGVPTSVLPKVLDLTAMNAHAMYQAGIPLLAGTDAVGHAGTPVQIPFGESLHKELELMSAAGIPNIEVLKAATSRPAKRWGMCGKGSIKVGKRADLVLVKGNPVANISETRGIRRVWVGGKEYKGE